MSTLNKYHLITKKKEQNPPNEIRITARGFNSSYISYAMKIFEGKEFNNVILKASGTAISKCCIVAEVLRHRIQGLALVSKIKNTQIHDEYEPKEEGLDNVTVTRNIAVLEILLTTDDKEDKGQVGYQAPLSEEDIKKSIKERDERRDLDRREEGGDRREGGRGNRRGGRGGRRGFRGRPFSGTGGDHYRERDNREERGGDREERGDRGYKGDRENRGYRGGGGYRGGNREDRGDREYRGYGGDRENRGYRGGGDRENRGEGDRERRGPRGGRGGYGRGGQQRSYSHSQEKGGHREERSPGTGYRGNRRGGRGGPRGNRRGEERREY